MKTTGIIRNIDELGRLVLPKEMRKHLEIDNNSPVEIFAEGDKIIVKKFAPRCVFCGSEGELAEYLGKKICHKCLEVLSSEI